MRNPYVFIVGPDQLNPMRLDCCQARMRELQRASRMGGGSERTRKLLRRLREVTNRDRFWTRDFEELDLEASFRCLARDWPEDIRMSAQLGGKFKIPYDRVVVLNLYKGTESKGGVKTLLKWIWQLGLLGAIGMSKL